jgi:hypothetical protein
VVAAKRVAVTVATTNVAATITAVAVVMTGSLTKL